MEYNYFEGRLIDVAVEHRRRINLQIHERFRIRDVNDPFQMSIPEFTRLYRMPQDAVVDLRNILAPHVRQHVNPQETTLIRKVLVALSVLGFGCYQRLVGRSIDCAVSQASVSKYLKEVVMALNHPAILTRFIRFPLTAEERAPIIRRNEELGLPRVLAFVDGSLVKVTHLPRDHERQAYFCRKGYTALNVQILCDADLRILNVNARFPGSVNDGMIWNASPVKEIVEQAYWEDRCWVLGDSGYVTAPWLHTPLPHALEGTPEYDYTILHCHCRNCVERCIGVLKARWRILCSDRALNYKNAGFCGCIVNACCVLHNFCLQRGFRNPAPLYDNLHAEVPEHNDLPRNLADLAQQEMNYLINFAHQRRLNRDNIVAAI